MEKRKAPEIPGLLCGLMGSGLGACCLFAGLDDATVNFLEACCLAAESAEVEELGAANLGRANDADAVNGLGVEGEDALYALAKADFADGEAALSAFVDSDDDALECLKAFFFAFLDLDLHAHGVARDKSGEVSAIDFIGKPLHDWMNRHSFFLAIDSEFLVYRKIGGL